MLFGVDGGAHADRGDIQPLGGIAELGTAPGQQGGGQLAPSQDAAVLAEDRHHVVADAGEGRDGLLPAGAQPLQVCGGVGYRDAGTRGHLLRAGPRRQRAAVRGPRDAGHLPQLGNARDEAVQHVIDGQAGEVLGLFRHAGRRGVAQGSKPGPFGRIDCAVAFPPPGSPPRPG